MSLIRSRASRAAVLVLLAGLPPAAAGAQDRPSEESLRAIEASGRRLASYREAVERCVAKMREQPGGAPESDIQIVVPKRAGGSHITFTRKAAPGQTNLGLLMVAEADFDDASGVVDHALGLPEPKPLPAVLLPYVKALQLVAGVVASRPDAKPPLVTSIFKEKDRGLTVYLQSQAGEGIVRFGGDFRVKASPDGQMVVGIEPLHANVTDVAARAVASSQPTLHMHESGDIPTDTDVALVLSHPTLAPHLVLTPSSMYRIDASGSITWLGPNQAPPGPKPSGKGAP